MDIGLYGVEHALVSGCLIRGTSRAQDKGGCMNEEEVKLILGKFEERVKLVLGRLYRTGVRDAEDRASGWADSPHSMEEAVERAYHEVVELAVQLPKEAV